MQPKEKTYLRREYIVYVGASPIEAQPNLTTAARRAQELADAERTAASVEQVIEYANGPSERKVVSRCQPAQSPPAQRGASMLPPNGARELREDVAYRRPLWLRRKKRRAHGRYEPTSNPEEDLVLAREAVAKYLRLLADGVDHAERVRAELEGAEIQCRKLDADYAKLAFWKRGIYEWISRDRAVLSQKIGELRNELRRLEQECVWNDREIAKSEAKIKEALWRIDAPQRAAERERSKQRAAERRQAKRALIARLTRQDRAQAAACRRQLERNDECPYCNISLNENAQADHIIPVAYGGLAVETNLVFVCATCNSRKRDLMLLEFITRFGLSRDDIFNRLRQLGKRF